MYLHLGRATVIRTQDIIGLFDLENTTVSRPTRDFLTMAEKAGDVVNVTDELPKTFALCVPEVRNRRSEVKRKPLKSKQVVYISQISTTTLLKRMEAGTTF